MQNLLALFPTDRGMKAFEYQEFLLIFVLASISGFLLSKLYFIYFRENEPQDVSLARSLAIITPALATLFWLIQHEITLSLGLLGSLAVIRFRSPVKRAEDIAFILLAITFSIIMSLQAWIVAAVLTVSAFAFAFGRNVVTIKGHKKGKFGIITVNSKSIKSTETIARLMSDQKLKSECVSVRTYDGIGSFVFNVPSIRLDQQDRVIAEITLIDEAAQINFYYPNERLGA